MDVRGGSATLAIEAFDRGARTRARVRQRRSRDAAGRSCAGDAVTARRQVLLAIGVMVRANRVIQ